MLHYHSARQAKIVKERAAMFKENIATSDQRMAVLDHGTEAEATHYAKSAD